MFYAVQFVNKLYSGFYTYVITGTNNYNKAFEVFKINLDFSRLSDSPLNVKCKAKGKTAQSKRTT